MSINTETDSGKAVLRSKMEMVCGTPQSKIEKSWASSDPTSFTALILGGDQEADQADVDVKDRLGLGKGGRIRRERRRPAQPETLQACRSGTCPTMSVL